MIRRIIHIDTEKCNGCGACAAACHEGAIGMVNGKAKLMRDDYCDGLGDCLPACPTGAITFVEREAAAYDEQAVKANQQAKKAGGCPGQRLRQFVPEEAPVSQLRQWPCQIKLIPVNAPYFNGADLLIAADCTAYAYAGMHKEFMQGRITVIGCPKLDQIDYSEKLGAMTLKALRWCAWRFPAAVDWRWRPSVHFSSAARKFPSGWLRSHWMGTL